MSEEGHGVWNTLTYFNSIIWLNGGPGCSSLIGFLQENGPAMLVNKGDTAKPNPFSWTQAANVLWIEQPVGVGFTTGMPTVQNEHDVAVQLSGFLANFFRTFPELAGKRRWLTGGEYNKMTLP